MNFTLWIPDKFRNHFEENEENLAPTKILEYVNIQEGQKPH